MIVWTVGDIIWIGMISIIAIAGLISRLSEKWYERKRRIQESNEGAHNTPSE